MLRRCTTLFCAAVGSLTSETLTRPASVKGKRMTRKAQQLIQRERLRRRRRVRMQDLLAKEAAMKEAVQSTSNARDVVMAQLADRIFSRGAKHLGSATNVSFVPDGNPAMPLVALAGRSRVGKTALLRALLRERHEVGRSNRVTRRDAMNFFNVGDVFNIVDLPGFGGTSVPFSVMLQHAVLLRNFARHQPSLKMLYYCMDVNYKNGLYVQDIDMLRFLSKEVPNFTIVITKAEQVDGAANFSLRDVRKELLFNDIHHPVMVTSAYRLGGIDTLRFDMTMNCLHALPTERLTLTEARRLSERLLSQAELSTIRHLPIPPRQIDDELREWKQELALLEKQEEEEEEKTMSSAKPTHVSPAQQDEVSHEEQPCGVPGPFDVSAAETAEEVKTSLAAHEPNGANPQETDAVVLADDLKAVATFTDPVKQLAYHSLLDKMRNTSLLRYVASTSPWRNPLKWPRNVVPTKHPKVNLMRCPEDPENPYLSQPTFVAPRADMYFRKPNVGVRQSSQKGRYETDKPLAFLAGTYTIPYFPDIVDVQMHPQPWTFLGSREAYFERSGGRELGIKMSHYALVGKIDALQDNPVPVDEQPLLAAELAKLEKAKYGQLASGNSSVPLPFPNHLLPSESVTEKDPHDSAQSSHPLGNSQFSDASAAMMKALGSDGCDEAAKIADARFSDEANNIATLRPPGFSADDDDDEYNERGDTPLP